MSDLNLENIVGFKAVDKNGNERQVTVDEMTELVSARIVSAASEISTFAAAAAAGTDEFEDQLPQSDTFSWLRTLDGSKNPTLTSSSAAAKVLGGLIGVTTPTKDGLMPKNQVCRNIAKINNLHCRLKCNISSPGEWVNGFLYVGSTSGSVSTIAVSVMIWNETKVFCKLINGVKGYISSISYIQETNSISLFVEMAQYANILFAPMTQLYSSSLETVESIPSDAINLDF
ncbi:hypothetical protein E1I98_06320 [Phocaeicola dorei]|jgi:hypothetical protein|uniref:Uncharacterized protein n=5 Tax=Phocaeicola TaxID=909656 RepID=A0A4R4GIU9_9BACT|nr:MULTISPECIES: hypothetical protein [Phocaeicola]TDA75993.1 hypothetical protein E1I98_06320 [Phocaeicola dorei]UVR03882.1 hypothetical protein NXX81_15785 [Phocaeicola vulgatus]